MMAWRFTPWAMASRTWSLARYGSAWLKSKCSNSSPGSVTLVVFGTWFAVCVIDRFTVAVCGVGLPESLTFTVKLEVPAALGVPVVTVVIGEGGSGGALGLGIANRVYMLENAYYSVISPESCAAIIYRDSGRAAEAAKALRLTAVDLEGLGLIDGTVKEPGEGAHTDWNKAAEFVKETIQKALGELAPLSREALIEERYNKFRQMGNFFAETV